MPIMGIEGWVRMRQVLRACTVVYAVVQRAMGASTSASSFFDCAPQAHALYLLADC